MARNDETLILLAVIICLIAVGLLSFGQGIELIGEISDSIGLGLFFVALTVLGVVFLIQRRRI